MAYELSSTFAGDDASILERAPGAPGKRALTDGLAPAAGHAGGTAAEPGALPVGMTFFDGGPYEWIVEADGSFRCIGDPPGAKAKSKGARIRKPSEVWDTLYAIARTQVAAPTPAVPAAPAVPATPPVPANDQRAEGAPAERSLLDELLAPFIPRPVAKLIDVGAKLLERGYHAFADDDAPEAQRPAAPDPFAAHVEPEGARAPQKAETAPAPEVGGEAKGVTGLSQFVWCGYDGRDLKADEVVNAINVIHKAYGFYPAAKLFAADDDTPAATRAKDGNEGYFWFRADGTPAWNGKKQNGGTQYIAAPIDFSEHVNNLMIYLATNPPGQRPKFRKPFYSVWVFGDGTGKGEWTEVPEDVRNLDVMNLPSVKSCMVTARVMMARANLTPMPAVADGVTDIAAEGIVDGKFHVTVDKERAKKMKAYLEFETSRGRPVMTGITKHKGKGNNDGFTDHWIVISGCPSDGVFTFFDPAEATSKQARDDKSNELHWDEATGAITGHGYTVAWARANQESHAEWLAHWAKLSGAATSTP